MMRFCLISSVAVAASVLLPGIAQAENTPAILYIPTEDVTLTPSGMGACQSVSMSAYNAALNCSPAITEETTISVVPDAAQLTADIAAALADFNVMVTNERPPEYIPYYMVGLRNEEFADSLNHACAGGPTVCASRGRNGIGTTTGGTSFCMNPDLVQAGLFAFGTMAGLEGVEDPADPMHYPPDFASPATAYQDTCMTISPFLGGEEGMTPQPLTCTSADHVGDCASGEQNSYQDLLAYFGAHTDDTDPPVVTVNSPEDGAVVAAGEALMLDATIEDADTSVGVRWTVESPVFEGMEDVDGLEDGKFTFCTNNQCDFNLLEGDPFKSTDSSWAAPPLSGLPGGEYTITLEATDYHGNEIEPIVMTVTVEGSGGGGETDSGDAGTGNGSGDTSDPTAGSGVFTTGDDSDGGTDDGGSGTGSMENEDDSGCGCTTGSTGGGVLMFGLGLLGLATGRRRRSA